MDVFLKSGTMRMLLAALPAVACCLLMVLFPSAALVSARKGISIWLTNVLPALLPFFICANFLQRIGVMRYLRAGVFPFAMSVLSGYPMGAKIVGDLRRNGDVSLNEAKHFMSFCSTSGPAFMVGAVGAGMLGSGTLGVIVAMAHYAGALMNGLLYGRLLGSEHGKASEVSAAGASAGSGTGTARKSRNTRNTQGAFTEAILMSFQSLSIIMAYIVLFMFATDLLQMSGILSMLGNEVAQALIKGFFEMTVGCGAAAECTAASGSVKCILCSAVMSWGGLSVLGQTMSMLSGTGITLGYLFLSKLTHSLFSAGAAFVLTVFVL